MRSSEIVTPFQTNTGELDRRVAFVAQTAAGSTFVTRGGRIVHSLPGPVLATKVSASSREFRAPARGRGWTLTETLVGARPSPQGGARSETNVSRFVGNDPSRWRSSVPTFESVLFGETWRGIRVEVVARGRGVEKIFSVAPGADPRRIAVRIGGANRLAIAPDGALVAHTGNGPVTFSAPAAWQDVDGQRRPVRVAYAVEGHHYRFALGPYDRALPLVVDPLLQATYLGGSQDESASQLAVAANGEVYVTGTTGSYDFPGTAGGFQPVAPSLETVFVAKLNRTLTTLVQATFLGGTSFEGGRGLALDREGNVIVVGNTSSRDFPGTTGGAQPILTSGMLGFVAKLGPSLTTLIQATYLGGGYATYAYAVAIDPSGSVFVCGATQNTSTAGFPGTAGGAQPSPGYWFAGGDGFVAKLDKGLTKLVQATYLGGSEDDFAASMTIDAAGHVYVAGDTASPDFPASAGAAQPARAGWKDAFVAKLDGSLHSFLRSTYLGGSEGESVARLALDGKGAVFVAGATGSSDFPATAGGAVPASTGGGGFVAKLNDDLTAVIQATYIVDGAAAYATTGGASATDVAVQPDGSVVVTGNTDATDLPGAAGGLQTEPGSIFVAKYDNSLHALIQSTYLGGWGSLGNVSNEARTVALDGEGNVFVAGSVGSLDFPGTAGGAQPQHAPDHGHADAFVAKLTPSLRRFDALAEAVEYYHAGFDHYVVTADPDEIAGLDRHVYPPVRGANWERTGQSFEVVMQQGTGVAPVCRFFGTFGDVSSHFYTADPVECAGLTARFPVWQFEKIGFAMPLPGADGRCESGAFPVYRMYNDGRGGAPNHRFTTHLPTRIEFVANRGWVAEGSGPIGVAMCSPQSAVAGSAEGIWNGATVSGSAVQVFVLDDGTYYLIYSIPETYNIGGMIQGRGTANGGRFATADAKDFSVSGMGVSNAVLGADYVPESSLDGDLTFSRSATSSSKGTRLIAAYEDAYDRPASTAAAAGTYVGLAGTSLGVQPATLTASQSGAISGSASGCSFGGTVKPRGTVNVFDFSITFNGEGCLFGTSTLVGFAYYDAANRQLLAFAPNASRTDSILFVGARP